MDIKLPVKIHNRFDIEVRDVISGEIVQRGQAENIVLNNLLTSSKFCNTTATDYIGYSLQFGSGTGVLSPDRTTLFNRIGGKEKKTVENNFNQAPVASYHTMKISLLPEEYVGATLTEVGIGAANNETIYTHALIKDSEGNQITLGPKTDTQEITIYATVYLQPNFPQGITFTEPFIVTDTNKNNGLLHGLTMCSNASFTTGTPVAYLYYDGNNTDIRFSFNNRSSGKFSTPKYRFQTDYANGKIKLFYPRATSTGPFGAYSITVNLPQLAQSGTSSIWNGYQFLNKNIGVGDGIAKTFNLPWSEINESRGYKFYIDGVETTAFTLANSETVTSVTFANPPANGAAITGDWWVDYVPKDSDHVLDIQFSIVFGEGI